MQEAAQKGLPNKKYKKLLNGKTLLEHSINCAKRSDLISKIFVSSDSEEILSISKKHGAFAIKRPNELASDISPEWLSWQHAISWVEDRYGEFDTFVSLPTTSPLRRVEDINKAIAMKDEGKADTIIGITESKNNPYFNMVKFDSDDNLTIISSLDKKITRRQDQPKVFNITTVVYATTFIH